MGALNRFTSRFGTGPDLLGFRADASPSANEWLVAFTRDFMRHTSGEHGTQALMSGVRFFSPEFVAEVGSLTSAQSPRPPMAGSVTQAIYLAAGQIIVDVYQRLIGRGAPQAEIQAAFATATPELVARYQQIMH